MLLTIIIAVVPTVLATLFLCFLTSHPRFNSPYPCDYRKTCKKDGKDYYIIHRGNHTFIIKEWINDKSIDKNETGERNIKDDTKEVDGIIIAKCSNYFCREYLNNRCSKCENNPFS